MKRSCLGVLAGAGLLVLVGGCSVLPTTRVISKSVFTNYTQVQASFDRIVPYQTHTSELKSLGFDPANSPNVKTLTYVDVMRYFMPNPAITKADLHPSVYECIDAKERGHAYQIELSNIRTKRYGNAFLDIFGFKRRTHETGWRFSGLILTTNGVVVYKLAAGEPVVSTDSERIRPLGPLQELDAVVIGVAGRVR